LNASRTPRKHHRTRSSKTEECLRWTRLNRETPFRYVVNSADARASCVFSCSLRACRMKDTCKKKKNPFIIPSIRQKTLLRRDLKTSPILENFDPTRETADFGTSQNFSHEVRSSRPTEAGPNLESLWKLNKNPRFLRSDSVFQFLHNSRNQFFPGFFRCARTRSRASCARKSTVTWLFRSRISRHHGV